jgi:hypothetical protein
MIEGDSEPPPTLKLWTGRKFEMIKLNQVQLDKMEHPEACHSEFISALIQILLNFITIFFRRNNL